MKKTLIVLGCLSLGLAHAQQGRTHTQHTGADARVGINTENPVATMEVSKVTGIPATQVQGFLLPHLTKEERDAMEKEALVNGLMIFNTTKNCIDWWDGAKWACTDGTKVDAPTPKLPATQPITLPNGITLDNSRKVIASIYDTDYLPYEMPTSVADWNNVAPIAADGVADKTIDYQGKVTTTGLSVTIPVRTTGSGRVPAYKTYVNIPAERTEDGQARVLELSWESQAFTTATKSIKATIKSVGGDLNVKKLDLKGGLGSDYKGLELGTFVMPQSATDGNLPANYKGKYELRVISGIPDKNFTKETIVNGENKGFLHQFIYLPIQGPDGRIWLNNNLGADYSNVNSSDFAPDKHAEENGDTKAYGSSFQWGREANGHELVKWIGGRQFIPAFEETPYNWKKDMAATLTEINENCPQGMHTPTKEEAEALVKILNERGSDYGYLALNMIPNFVRNVLDGSRLILMTQRPEFWVYDGGQVPGAMIKSSSWGVTFGTGVGKSAGRPIRCIKN